MNLDEAVVNLDGVKSATTSEDGDWMDVTIDGDASVMVIVRLTDILPVDVEANRTWRSDDDVVVRCVLEDNPVELQP